MKSVVWLHDDALRHWYGESPAVYVFDDEKLKHERWSLKRIGFIYECLLELPVEIRRGNPVTEVLAFQKSHDADQVLAIQTPDPHLRQQMLQIRAESVPDIPFVELSGKVDLKRFSRYWAKAERALQATVNLK